MTNINVKKEIEELHVFFCNWFNGSIGSNLFERFINVLADNFELITPRGTKFNKDEISDLIKTRYNTLQNMKIWVDDLRLVLETDNLVIAEYKELQTIDDVFNKRWSTVIFEKTTNNYNGLTWFRVHETWFTE
jgi:hypothetical protein